LHPGGVEGLAQEQQSFGADLRRICASGVEQRDRNPTVLVTAKVASALGINLATLLEFNNWQEKNGAAEGTRTPDPIITNDKNTPTLGGV